MYICNHVVMCGYFEKMKRKVVRHGPSSLTISLPMKWVKKNNISAGDEIEVKDLSNTLVLGGTGSQARKSITIDVTGIGRSINRVIGSVYRAGYDDVLIKYSTPEEFRAIQDQIEKSLKGFEVFRYSSKEILIKSIYQQNVEDFDNVLQRYFYAIKTVGVDLRKVLENPEKEFLNTIILQDRTIDRHSNFLRRILNKGLQTDFDRPHCVYYIIEELEICADMYKEIATIFLDESKKINKNYLSTLEKINTLFDYFLRAFFNFNQDRLKDLITVEKEIYTEFEKLKKDNSVDIEIYSQLYLLFRSIYEMKCALYTGFLK